MKPKISFFYRWTNGTGKVRGKQMGQYIKANFPKKDYDFSNDVCIYVKVAPPDDYPKRTYLDIADALERVRWLKKHPDVKVICISKSQMEYLSKKLKNELILIPENHCNYLRERRTRKEVTTVGYIGRPNGLGYVGEKAGSDAYVKELENRIKELGMDFIYEVSYPNREDVCAFYKKIDIQIAFRSAGLTEDHLQMRNPLKLANACSFGVPTVAYPEISYVKEFDGYFLPATTIDEMIDQIKVLRDDEDLYNRLASEGIKKAEEYHIENISKLYLALAEERFMQVSIKAKLIEKEVMIDGQLTPIYGLASFNVRPRPRGLGKVMCKEFDRLATEDGRYCVIGFAFDEVAGFYDKCGWYPCGKYGLKTIYASKPINKLEVTEEW